jgi:hypothetical protein
MRCRLDKLRSGALMAVTLTWVRACARVSRSHEMVAISPSASLSLAAETRNGSSPTPELTEWLSSGNRMDLARLRAARVKRLEAGLHHSPCEAQSLGAWRTSWSPPWIQTHASLKTPNASAFASIGIKLNIRTLHKTSTKMTVTRVKITLSFLTFE